MCINVYLDTKTKLITSNEFAIALIEYLFWPFMFLIAKLKVIHSFLANTGQLSG